jgi:hypothetical protein
MTNVDLATKTDPCSFSNPDFYTIKHISLDWTINFADHTLNGFVILNFELHQTPNRSNKIVIFF